MYLTQEKANKKSKNIKDYFLIFYLQKFLVKKYLKNFLIKNTISNQKKQFFFLFYNNLNFRIFIKKTLYFTQKFKFLQTFIFNFINKFQKKLKKKHILLNFNKNILFLIRNNIFLKKKHLLINLTLKKKNFVLSAIDKTTMKILYQISAGTNTLVKKAKRRDIYNIYNQILLFIKQIKIYNYFFFIIQTKKHNFLRKRILKFLIDNLLNCLKKDLYLFYFIIQKYYIPIFFLNLFQNNILKSKNIEYFLNILLKKNNKRLLFFFIYRYIIFLNIAHNGCRLRKQQKK